MEDRERRSEVTREEEEYEMESTTVPADIRKIEAIAILSLDLPVSART